MNTQDKRFLAAVLGEGISGDHPPGMTDLGAPGNGGFSFGGSLEWPFAPHAGIKTLITLTRSFRRPDQEHLILTASWGGDLTGTELSVGLDLDLEPQDTNDVFGKSDHLVGQLVAPETAQATRNTVQIEFAERLTPGTTSFGLAKLRGRILWQAGSRHILRIHRQMPIGWPGGDHHETDESAFTGRTEPMQPRAHTYRARGSRAVFGVPILTPDRRKTIEVSIDALTTTVAWLREHAAG